MVRLCLREATFSSRRKKALWDRRYEADYPRWQPPPDAVACLREGLSDTGSLLDLGCGTGNLLKALRNKGWRGPYCGVDISRAAIEEANAIADPSATWAVSPIEAFRTKKVWDAVSMIECAYYVEPTRLQSVLLSILGMIRDGGFLLIRIHDFSKHARCVAMIEELSLAQRAGDRLIRITAEVSRAVRQR